MSAPRAPAISPHKVRWAPVQVFACLVAAVFLLVGILGFIPGVTTDYHAMTWAGHASEAKLLGVFAVSVLHNIIHVAFGMAGGGGAVYVYSMRGRSVAQGKDRPLGGISTGVTVHKG